MSDKHARDELDQAAVPGDNSFVHDPHISESSQDADDEDEKPMLVEPSPARRAHACGTSPQSSTPLLLSVYSAAPFACPDECTFQQPHLSQYKSRRHITFAPYRSLPKSAIDLVPSANASFLPLLSSLLHHNCQCSLGQPGGFAPPQQVSLYEPFQPSFPQPHLPPLHPGSPPLRPGSPPISDYLSSNAQSLRDTLVQPTPYSSQANRFQLHDDGVVDDFGDTGDIPLLRHDGPMGRSMPIPGEYDPVIDDDRSESNIRYGRIPQRVPRRYKAIKKVELFHGNFVLDSAVPTKLLDMCAQRNEREFMHMQYSAATCDPNEFKDSGFTLRQVHYDLPRKTELFIVMTMYHEDEEQFCWTMHGVMKNIVHLCKRDRSKTWGKEGWKKVVVCIVSDGRQKINSRTLSVIAMMGAYQDGVTKNIVHGKPMTAHIYEYTTHSMFCLYAGGMRH
ncbi:hypothetical protein GSI_01744 [Ganoderma sinense ZZ0214-1]|uniref:Chitin synthase n=1 Tax=Ganoderma sinense ZZ0214-1 TaxID=1077348 RepID=A0A2G8SQN9_9APHY|nr:hypothetical protein GSI_01744 [Ganoderma sinense ZZ0214-1]